LRSCAQGHAPTLDNVYAMMRRREMEGADKSDEHEAVPSRSSSTTAAAAGVSRRAHLRTNSALQLSGGRAASPVRALSGPRVRYLGWARRSSDAGLPRPHASARPGTPSPPFLAESSDRGPLCGGAPQRYCEWSNPIGRKPLAGAAAHRAIGPTSSPANCSKRSRRCAWSPGAGHCRGRRFVQLRRNRYHCPGPGRPRARLAR